MRKTAPFPIEQAVLSISPGARSADGTSEFVVALAREDVIHQYEQACLMAGAHAGLVDLSTFGVINSILSGSSAPTGDWLLVHVDRHLPHAGGDARQRAVVLPQPRRGRGHARGPDPPDGDVLRGSPERRRFRARADRRRRASARRRGDRAARLEDRLKVAVEAVDPRDCRGACRIASARRRNCSTCWRRSSAS